MDHDLNIMKRVARQQRLDREKAIGKPRAKSWSGKPDSKSDRRSWKRQARDH